MCEYVNKYLFLSRHSSLLLLLLLVVLGRRAGSYWVRSRLSLGREKVLTTPVHGLSQARCPSSSYGNFLLATSHAVQSCETPDTLRGESCRERWHRMAHFQTLKALRGCTLLIFVPSALHVLSCNAMMCHDIHLAIPGV
jgi:hypothetical protein